MVRDYLFEFSPSIDIGARAELTAQEHFARSFRLPLQETVAEMGLRRVEDDLRNIIESAMPRVLDNIYAAPLSQIRALALSPSLNDILQENYLGISKSVTGLGLNLAQISESLDRIALPGSLLESLERGLFINSLPDLTPTFEFVALMEDAAEGQEALQESGFGFATLLFNLRQRAELAGLSPRIKFAVVTQRMRNYTRTDDFEHELVELLGASDLLKHRLDGVKLILQAHRNRHYALSVPAALPHVEGVIRDAIVLKRLVIVQKHRTPSGSFEIKLFAKDQSGGYKLGPKSGQPIELTKARMLLHHANLASHPYLEEAGSAITDHVLDKRNVILHGYKNSHTTAALSTQALLLLFVMAGDIVAFETGNL